MSLTNPNYFDRKDRELFDDLFYKRDNRKPLTQTESNFVSDMLTMEEYAVSDFYEQCAEQDEEYGDDYI